jgi:hypothetical protein
MHTLKSSCNIDAGSSFNHESAIKGRIKNELIGSDPEVMDRLMPDARIFDVVTFEAL